MGMMSNQIKFSNYRGEVGEKGSHQYDIHGGVHRIICHSKRQLRTAFVWGLLLLEFHDSRILFNLFEFELVQELFF